MAFYVSKCVVLKDFVNIRLKPSFVRKRVSSIPFYHEGKMQKPERVFDIYFSVFRLRVFFIRYRVS